MQVGFALNEWLALATLVTGALRLAWWRRRRRGGAASRPAWVRWGADLFPVIALIFAFRVGVADWQRVPSTSMEPTLRVGDLLLINHLAYGPRLPFTNAAIRIGTPQRGDVVVFRFPQDVSQFYVKRLIGLPGDRVDFKDGVVTIDGATTRVDDLGWGGHDGDRGQMILRERIGGMGWTIKLHPFVLGKATMTIGAPHCAAQRAGAWTCVVPPGHLLVLGDNRDQSVDSRAWGFLSEREVYGRVDRVLFNFVEWTRWWHPVAPTASR